VKITKRGVIHKLAECSDCDWNCEDYQTDVKKRARYHAEKNKHIVNVEYGDSTEYNGNRP